MPLFADNPAAFFLERGCAPHQLPYEEQVAHQLSALQARFGAMRDALPPLKAMADMAGISEIRAIPDIAPLLFPHSFYKSYDEYTLAYGHYGAVAEWLQNFTLNDLSMLQDRDFDTLDDFLAAMDAETGLKIFHSSGTTGRMSFYPRGKKEFALQDTQAQLIGDEWIEPIDFDYEPSPKFALIWPSYADGHTALLHGGQMIANGPGTLPGHFYPLIDARMSSDLTYYMMRCGTARERQQAPPPANDYVKMRIAESEAINSTIAERQEALLDKIAGPLKGIKCLLAGGPVVVHRLAAAGLARGMESALAPGSFIRCFGGIKGFDVPPAMEQTILRFSGAGRMTSSYGMTELTTGSVECRHRRYHCFPWILPMVLDETTGTPLPRTGVQKGRAAFFDLQAQTYWGGVVSADRVELSWEPCPCGRTTPHFGPEIARIPQDEDDHAIGAASAEAVHAALMATRN